MRQDAFWSGLEACAGALCSVTTSFAIARLIGPAELGIGAAIVAVHVVLWVAVNALFADALVQLPSVDDRILSTAFWASSIAGASATLLQAGAGLALAATIGDPRLAAMGLALAAPLPLVGAAGPVQGLLTRERAYRGLALRTVVGQGLGTLVGIAAASAGAGAWALVSQQAVTSTVGALTLLLGRAWSPSRCLDGTALKTLLRVGAPLTASTLVLIARYRVFAVLIGGSAGPAVLGQVHIAFRLVDTTKELAFTALWRLMLPRMACDQHDRRALLAQVDRWLRLCAGLIVPLAAIMGIGLGPIIAALMGPGWAEAARAAAPLAALMAWSAVTFPAGVAMVATGKVRVPLYANLLSLLAAITGVLLFPPATCLQAAIIWTVSQLAAAPYLLWANGRALDVGWLRPLTGGARLPAWHAQRL